MPETQTTTAEEVVLIKKGTELLKLEFKRCAKGLKVEVKAHAMLEDYFKELSNERLQADGWQNTGGAWLETEHKVMYRISGMDSIPRPNSRRPAYLALPGYALDYDGGLNLSFLLFKGIAAEEGVSFTCRGVYSAEKVRTLAEEYRQAIRDLYVDYIRPVSMTVMVTAGETL